MSIIKKYNGRNNIEKSYLFAKEMIAKFLAFAIPHARYIQRFLALPYCFLFLSNLKEIDHPKHRIALDFLYIFFVLKSFPDNYQPCRLWKKPKSDWAYYYGSNYNPFQRRALRTKLQIKKYEILYEDKWICTDLCKAKNIPLPLFVGNIKAGENFAKSIRKITQDFPKISRFIIKPIDGKGGHAIIVVERFGENLYKLEDGKRIEIPNHVANTTYIVQEYISQHHLLNEFSNSVNTIRIVTLLRPDGTVHIIGSYLRFGVGDSPIDNLSQGGIAVRIEAQSGTLASCALDRFGHQFSVHPTSGKAFENFTVPHWSGVVRLATEIQQKLNYQLLLGMDIAVTENGPILIEINSIYDNVDLEQVCGPILKNQETFELYKDYGLLINKKQKMIAYSKY